MSVLTKVLIPIKALKPVFTIFSFQLIETICTVKIVHEKPDPNSITITVMFF